MKFLIMPLFHSSLYLLLRPYIFPFHHSFTLPRYMDKQGNISKPCKFSCRYYRYASHHILYNMKFCLTAYFKQDVHTHGQRMWHLRMAKILLKKYITHTVPQTSSCAESRPILCRTPNTLYLHDVSLF
jgi:hypothetical protein